MLLKRKYYRMFEKAWDEMVNCREEYAIDPTALNKVMMKLAEDSWQSWLDLICKYTTLEEHLIAEEKYSSDVWTNDVWFCVEIENALKSHEEPVEAAEVEIKEDEIENEVEEEDSEDPVDMLQELEEYLEIMDGAITAAKRPDYQQIFTSKAQQLAYCVCEQQNNYDRALIILRDFAPEMSDKGFELYVRKLSKLKDDLEILQQQYLEGGLNDVKN